ncbi:hypothetical protein [Chryseobacterium viscerum]|uniref:hypothetical protein n=1 Tax=Chryseobacterium viscerum TaxID=1037377 RepID=UPI001401FC8E|nr:hypothetical protein [Chryseobacterium viscerum]
MIIYDGFSAVPITIIRKFQVLHQMDGYRILLFITYYKNTGFYLRWAYFYRTGHSI